MSCRVQSACGWATRGNHERFVNFIEYSGDGKLTAPSLRFDVCVWDAESGALEWGSFRRSAVVMQLIISPDGKHLTSCSADCTAQMLDVHDGAVQAVLTGHEGVVYSIAFSPDGKRLLSVANDGMATVCDSFSGEKLLEIAVGNGLMNAAAMVTGRKFAVMEGHSNDISHMQCSLSGQMVVSSANDTLRLWKFKLKRGVHIDCFCYFTCVSIMLSA